MTVLETGSPFVKVLAAASVLAVTLTGCAAAEETPAETDAAFRAKMSLWQRLRYCWQVLLYKKPYADEIMLNNKQLLALKTFLGSLELQ